MSVRVGVAAIVRYGDNVLMGRRKGSHGSGTWSFPGGHLEEKESVFKCASREVQEETGLVIRPTAWEKLTFTNDVFEADKKHYVTLYVETRWNTERDGLPEPKVMEPDKCDIWNWFAKAPASSALFLPVRNLIADGFEIWHQGLTVPSR